jgi:hypothetical protein
MSAKLNITSRNGNNTNLFNNNNNGPSNNYNSLFMVILGGLTILFVFLFFFSQKYRVGRSLNNLDIYIKFQNMESLKLGGLKDYRLCDFYVLSSYNTALSGTQMFDYVTTDMVKKVLQTGARYLEFQVFGDQYGPDAEPVVSSGYKQGEWKLSLNTLYFEDVIKTIKEHAFKIYDGTDGSPNYLDPLIISLDLKTNYNYFVNNKIQKIITKYLLDRLLDPTYNYQSKNVAKTPIRDLMGKVIIFSSDQFQGSNLAEIVNYSWAFPQLKRYHYSELKNQSSSSSAGSITSDISNFFISSSVTDTAKTIETGQITKFNASGLSIIYPHQEGDILTSNYDPSIGWDLGCQFVGMNFQTMDTNMDKYINKFRYKAFVLKPEALRKV